MTVSAVTACLDVATPFPDGSPELDQGQSYLIQMGIRHGMNASLDTRGVCRGSSPPHAEPVQVEWQ